MKEFMTVGYKTSIIKTMFVLLGVIVMGLVSWMVLSFTWLGLLLVGVFGYWYWSWSRIFLRVAYHFEKDQIRLVLPSSKEILLSKQDIQEMKMMDTDLGRWRVGVFVRDGNEYVVTSAEHLVQIVMQDGRVVVISPRRLPSLSL